ncbi:28S ribosomal protein S29, mitochondrial-like, partial [Oncorhynchus keta]|uniref:28S ribosomal protein S29, mitochondrial-like n=1 Tax=Oncorhynchus keta TaxID=8018 RepID=UPI00227CD7B1
DGYRLGGFRLAVDGVNGLWGRTTLKEEEKSPVLIHSFTSLWIYKKWLTVEGQSSYAVSDRISLRSSSAYLPQELLGEEGFDSMDPFVPVPVSLYSEKEFESCYLYYLDRHWLQHPHSQTEEGKKELIFLSNRNPSVLERLCDFL